MIKPTIFWTTVVIGILGLVLALPGLLVIYTCLRLGKWIDD